MKRGVESARSGVVAAQIESADAVAGNDGLEIPDVLALDRALADLEAMDPQQGRVVELKFFAA